VGQIFCKTSTVDRVSRGRENVFSISVLKEEPTMSVSDILYTSIQAWLFFFSFDKLVPLESQKI